MQTILTFVNPILRAYKLTVYSFIGILILRVFWHSIIFLLLLCILYIEYRCPLRHWWGFTTRFDRTVHLTFIHEPKFFFCRRLVLIMSNVECYCKNDKIRNLLNYLTKIINAIRLLDPCARTLYNNDNILCWKLIPMQLEYYEIYYNTSQWCISTAWLIQLESIIKHIIL